MPGFAISILRKINHILYGGIRDNIVFLHMPKCAGQSIDFAIRRHCRFSYVHLAAINSFNAATLLYQLDDPAAKEFDEVLKFREYLLLYFMSHKEINYISGHFCFSENVYRHFHDTHKLVTVLRDPVNRWISSYFFHRYREKHSDYIKIEDDLPRFLQSERGENEGHLYVRMIGGINNSGDYTSRQAIDRAKANLHKFEIVGFSEVLDDFLNQFEHRFGVKLRISKRNKNPKPPEYIQSLVTKGIEEKITQICQPDIALYRYAYDTFVKRN